MGVVQDRGQDPVVQHGPDKDVHLCPPRDHQWAPNPSYRGPIERDNAHPEPILDPKQLVDDQIVRRDPAYPRKYGEGLEEVTGEEEDEGADEDADELSIAYN